MQRSRAETITSTAAAHGIPKLECLQCGHRWWPRKPERPAVCPSQECHSPRWDRPKVKKRSVASA